MPGPTNATNRFGSSSYVVGTPANGLGNGVNFTSIQAAIDQAVADGYGPLNPTTIEIRPGVYTENLNMTDGGIALVGPDALLGAACIITGLMTLTVSAALNAFSFSNLTFSNNASVAIYMTGGAFPFRGAFSNCRITCSDPGTNAIEIDIPSGTFGFATMHDTNITSDGNCIYNNSRTIFVLNNCELRSTNGSAVVLDSTGQLQTKASQLTSNSLYGILFNTASNQVVINSSSISSPLAALETTVGGNAFVFDSLVTSVDPSGFWITGTATLEYCNVINQGASIGIDPGLASLSIPDWKPYAEAGAAPGTGVVKGTCCFDSTQFTVVDGFVQSLGGSGLFPWVEQNASVTVNPNEGNFSVAAITLTLPAQPQPIGTTCKFKVVTNDVLNIAGNPGDVIQLGSQSGSSLDSTSSGDAIELTHYDLGIWLANASIGNWTVNP